MITYKMITKQGTNKRNRNIYVCYVMWTSNVLKSDSYGIIHYSTPAYRPTF